MNYLRLPFCLLLFLTIVTQGNTQEEKLKGITLVASPDPMPPTVFDELAAIGANYVVVNPFAFSRSETSTEIFYELKNQWWGETQEGIIDAIQKAHAADFKVMLKPQVWIQNGWVGNVRFDSLSHKMDWQKNYRDYILNMAHLAANQNVELFCIGTEFDALVIDDLDFWKGLIRDVRRIYFGAITYASNWTDYHNLAIWKYVDYIGIDAYFPLHAAKTPSVNQLVEIWDSIKVDIEDLSQQYEKQILFTEFGYLSVDGGAHELWKLEPIRHTLPTNEVTQANAYRALLQSFLPEQWFKGVFLWKWYPNPRANLGEGQMSKDYTPQGKMALKVLREEFSR